MEQTQSQKLLIREHLQKGGSLTALEALREFGCFRLASRISDLRSDGMSITKTMEESISSVTGKTVRIARYKLEEQSPKHEEGIK